MKLLALAAFAAWAGLAGRSMAQSLNVDVGVSGGFGTPSSGYGAAAGATGVGFWNAFDPASAAPVALLDHGMQATAVTLSITGGQGNFSFDNPSTVGDVQALMDDTGDLNLSGGGLDQATYVFSNLANGRYEVYVYAWAPDSPSFTTDVEETEGAPCEETCGGANWGGAHVEGATYTHDTVAVSTNSLTIKVRSNLGWGSCNGIQLVQTGSRQGVIRRSCVLPTVVESNPKDVEFAFGYMWVSGDRGNSALPWLHILSTTCGALASHPAMSSGGLSSRLLGGTVLRRQVIVSEATCSESLYEFDPQAGPTGSLGCTDISSGFRKTDIEVDMSRPTESWSLNPAGGIDRYTIDENGNQVYLGTFASTGLNLRGLVYDWVSDILWGFARSSPCAGATTGLAEFHALNPSTGQLLGFSFLGDMSLPGPNLAVGCGGGIDADGELVIVALHDCGPDTYIVTYELGVSAIGPAASYCTAGTSSSGCVPLISATNNPSAQPEYACTLSVTGVEGQKSGLFFFGASGALASPWGGGSSSFLCVKAPTQRAGTQNSGGSSGLCDGSYALDWNAFALANPTALGAPFTPGEKLYVQAWYRDPPAAKTTNLTAALELTIQP